MRDGVCDLDHLNTVVAEGSSEASSVGACSFHSSPLQWTERVCPCHQLAVTGSICGHRQRSETLTGVAYESSNMDIKVGVDTQDDFRWLHAAPSSRSHRQAHSQDRTLTVQNKAPIRSLRLDSTTLVERLDSIDRSTQRQLGQSQHGSDRVGVRGNLRLSVPAVALATHRSFYPMLGK